MKRKKKQDLKFDKDVLDCFFDADANIPYEQVADRIDANILHFLELLEEDETCIEIKERKEE